MSAVDPVERPTSLGAGAAVAVAALAVGLLLPTWDARATLLAELAAVGVLAGGVTAFRRGHRAAGGAVALVGTVAAVGALGVAVSAAGGLPDLVVTLAGGVGVFVLASALIPLRGAGSRALVKLGTGTAFVAVLGAGLFRLVSLQTLLVAGAGTVVAWDLGEQAINVGEQLGRTATTRRLEAVHGGGSLLVGAVAVGAGSVVAGVGSPGLPLPALAALLVAVLLFTAALHA